MNDEQLRKRIRLLKAQEITTYKKIAEAIGIKQRSMYNWLAEQYDFSRKKKNAIIHYLNTIGE